MRHDSLVSHVLRAVPTAVVIGLTAFVSQAPGFSSQKLLRPHSLLPVFAGSRTSRVLLWPST